MSGKSIKRPDRGNRLFGKEGEPAIRYEHVDKVYKGGIEAVKDLDIEIGHGEFAMLVGSSGGGKTTVLKMANGLIEPTAGSVFYYGDDLKNLDLVSLRRQIGYSIQGSVLFPHLTVEKNILYVPHLRGFSKEECQEAVERTLALVDLDSSLLCKYPHELSGGQAQRVGIARALAAKPYLLLMDEPFGAVDEITRRGLQEQIQNIYRKEPITIMFVTHDIGEALHLGTKILVMNEGVLQQAASPDEILANPATDYVRELVRDRI